MQHELAGLLERIAPPGSFAVERSAPADALRIEIEGIGPLRMPLSAQTIAMLRDVAKPSRYGLRERTVYDTKVRDSREIARRRIRIDQPRWNATLVPLLDEIRAGLGLAEGVELQAGLHNLLLYQRGQFFAFHQDSEKEDGMIGTLVVTLPSSFRGGEMKVEQHGEVLAFRGSRTALQLVAFYADCYHEVGPVTSGARVVLTYTLTTKGSPVRTPPPVEPQTLDALAGALQRHFTTPVSGRFGTEPTAPDRLVYLLDHQYTARGLRWDLLKGADAARATALRTAGERLDCEVFLAQADVHETWECETAPVDWYSSRRRWEREESDDFGLDEEDEGGGDDGDPILSDLIDSDIELRAWIAPGAKKPAEIASAVSDDELCYTRPSVDLDPFQSDYTGYMGNWGNQMDRWYHRAAIVMWPRERTFVIRARASAAWALQELVRALRRGQQEDARRKAESLLPFWNHATGLAAERLMPNALRVAAGLGDPVLASRFLRPLPLNAFDVEAASLFLPLLERFGPAWSEETLSALAASRGDSRREWLATLPRICEELTTAGDTGWALARWLTERQWEWLESELRDAESAESPSRAAAAWNALVSPLASILESTTVIGTFDVHESIVQQLAATRTERRVNFLMALLRATPERDIDVLRPLSEVCAEALAARLSDPPRESGDWSIVTELSCRCDKCRKLGAFLKARDQRVYEWPLAQESREHVHRAIERHELPLDHRTRRTGRPYTLVLTKRETLFAQDAGLRARWINDLAWLKRYPMP